MTSKIPGAVNNAFKSIIDSCNSILCVSISVMYTCIAYCPRDLYKVRSSSPAKGPGRKNTVIVFFQMIVISPVKIAFRHYKKTNSIFLFFYHGKSKRKQQASNRKLESAIVSCCKSFVHFTKKTKK